MSQTATIEEEARTTAPQSKAHYDKAQQEKETTAAQGEDLVPAKEFGSPVSADTINPESSPTKTIYVAKASSTSAKKENTP